VELPEPAMLPDPGGGSKPESGAFAMAILSLSRTERTANLRQIFEVRRNLNQSELDLHMDTCVAGGNTTVINFTDTKVNVIHSQIHIRPSRTSPLLLWQRHGTTQELAK
jgi:hypothetical protein